MRKNNFINRLNSFQKLIISVVVAVIAYLIFPIEKNHLLHLIFSWNIFCSTQIILSWITFYTMQHADIQAQAQRQDDGKVIVFLLVLLACILSMVATIMLLTHLSADDIFGLITAVSCMILSWFLVHTLYTARYAHLYYSGSGNKKKLDFPNQEHPDYLDFAYFSFTMGMTFQVSDVEITSSRIRHIALWHGLLSFAFNAVIIALTINTVASLSK